jgi:hypothetical protein
MAFPLDEEDVSVDVSQLPNVTSPTTEQPPAEPVNKWQMLADYTQLLKKTQSEADPKALRANHEKLSLMYPIAAMEMQDKRQAEGDLAMQEHSNVIGAMGAERDQANNLTNLLSSLSHAAAGAGGVNSGMNFAKGSDEEYQAKKEAMRLGLQAKLRPQYLPRMPGLSPEARPEDPRDSQMKDIKLKLAQKELAGGGDGTGPVGKLKPMSEIDPVTGHTAWIDEANKIFVPNADGTALERRAKGQPGALVSKTTLAQTEKYNKSVAPQLARLSQIDLLEKELGFSLDTATDEQINKLPLVTGAVGTGSPMVAQGKALLGLGSKEKSNQAAAIDRAMAGIVNKDIHDFAGSAATKQEMARVMRQFESPLSTLSDKIYAIRDLKGLIKKGIEETGKGYSEAATGNRAPAGVSNVTDAAPATPTATPAAVPGFKPLDQMSREEKLKELQELNGG